MQVPQIQAVHGWPGWQVSNAFFNQRRGPALKRGWTRSKSWASLTSGAFALNKRTISGARNGTPADVRIPIRSSRCVMAGFLRNTHVAPDDSLNRNSMRGRFSDIAWTSWIGGSSHSPSAHGSRWPSTTFSNAQAARCVRSSAWSFRKIATSMSSCSRVSRPRKRSIAHPPAMYQGRGNPRISLATSRTGPNVGMVRGLFLRPPSHLAEARSPVIRDSFEDLEGYWPVVSAHLQRLRVSLDGDCAFSERQVFVAGLAVPSVVVVHVHESEAVGECREVGPRTVRPIVEMRVSDVQAGPQVRHRVEDRPHDLRRLVDVLHGHDRTPVRRGSDEVGEPRRLRLRRDPRRGPCLHEMCVEDMDPHRLEHVDEADEPGEVGLVEVRRREMGGEQGEALREGLRFRRQLRRLPREPRQIELRVIEAGFAQLFDP